QNVVRVVPAVDVLEHFTAQNRLGRHAGAGRETSQFLRDRRREQFAKLGGVQVEGSVEVGEQPAVSDRLDPARDVRLEERALAIPHLVRRPLDHDLAERLALACLDEVTAAADRPVVRRLPAPREQRGDGENDERLFPPYGAATPTAETSRRER